MSIEQDQLLIEADLPEETGQEHDEWITVRVEWMAALAHHAAAHEYASADDYYELEFVRDATQQAWSQGCKTLPMTQSDLNNLPKWLDEVKAAHKIRTNDGDLGGTPTQLNFKMLVAFGLI